MAFGTGASCRQRRLSRVSLHALRDPLDRRHVPRPAQRLARQVALRACRSAAYPIQLAVNSPSAAWRWMQRSFADARRAAGRERTPHDASTGARDAHPAVRGTRTRERQLARTAGSPSAGGRALAGRRSRERRAQQPAPARAASTAAPATGSSRHRRCWTTMACSARPRTSVRGARKSF